MNFQNSYLKTEDKVLEVGKARPVLKSHLLRLRSSTIRQDSNVVKAKAPQLHRACVRAASMLPTHISTPSRDVRAQHPQEQLFLTCPHFWVPGRSKKICSIKVNVGIKRKIKGDQGRRQRILRYRLWISVTMYCALSHWATWETVEMYCLEPGLVVYIR